MGRFWGRDVFISYSRADGAAYAVGLAAELSKRKFACVIDQWGMSTPGKATPAQLLRVLRSCRAMILVSTLAAGQSEHVAKEVEEFRACPGMIIPIDLDGSIREAAWWPSIEGLPIAAESGGPAATGPDDAVLERIVNALTFRRRDQRLRRTALASASVLGLMLVGIAGLAMQSSRLAAQNEKTARDLNQSRTELGTVAGKARAAEQGLARTTADLATQRVALATAQQATSWAREEARRATLAAGLARREAQVAQTQASAARATALAARREAERQLAIAGASRLASLSEQSGQPPVAALLAAQSLERAWTVQGSRAAVAALGRLPGLVRRFDMEAEPSEIALSASGRFLAATEPIRAMRPDGPGSPASVEVPEESQYGLRLWDVGSGRQIARPRRDRMVGILRFSDDGAFLADGGCDGKVTITATETGAAVARIVHERSCPNALLFNENAQMLAVAGTNSTAVYELPSGRRVRDRPHGPRYIESRGWYDGRPAPSVPAPGGDRAPAQAVLFAPGSRRFLVAAGREIWVTDLPEGASRPIRLAGNANALALSPDGAVVAVSLEQPDPAQTADNAGRDERPEFANVFLFDVESGRELGRLANYSAFDGTFSLAFSPDGGTLIVGNFSTLRLFDWRSGRRVLEIPGSAILVAVSSDGTRLLASGRDGAAVYNARTGAPLSSTTDTGDHRRAAFSADGNLIATAQDDTRVVRVRSIGSTGEVARFALRDGPATSLGFSVDGGHLAVGALGKVLLWDLPAGTGRVFELGHRFEVDRIAFGAGSRTITAIASRGGQAHSVDPADGSVRAAGAEAAEHGSLSRADSIALVRNPVTRRHIENEASGTIDIILNPSRTRLALRTGDRLEVFDTQSGGSLFSRDFPAFSGGGAFDPSGRWLALGQGSVIAIFDTEDGTLVSEIEQPGAVMSLAFDPTGHRLAVSTSGLAGYGLSVWLWQRGDVIAELCRRIDGSVPARRWMALRSPDASPDPQVCDRAAGSARH